MLNKNGERELAYVVKVNKITPMNADRLECAHIDGWHCVVGKGEFKEGDLAIYFEIDSKLPEVEPFTSMEFLKSKNYKVKTQKIRGEYSQGLLVSLSAFNFEVNEGDFLTQKLGVTYADSNDNTRKAPSVDKYKKMAQRRPKLFAKPFARWMMRREWGKKIMFFFFGRKKDKKGGWPQWVKKTDEERIECCPFYLNDKRSWIATEKLDGTSTTFTLKRGKWPRKNEFYVCSRNVVFDKPDKQCYYENNVYLEMASKYDIETKMTNMLQKHPEWDWITLQGETYGGGLLGDIQKNTYDLDEHKLAIFNLVTSDKGRWNSLDMVKYLKDYDIPCVPILSEALVLPSTIEELRAFVHSAPSTINGKMKEGIVFRSLDGIHSFKCVDPEYLIKMH